MTSCRTSWGKRRKWRWAVPSRVSRARNWGHCNDLWRRSCRRRDDRIRCWPSCGSSRTAPAGSWSWAGLRRCWWAKDRPGHREPRRWDRVPLERAPVPRLRNCRRWVPGSAVCWCWTPAAPAAGWSSRRGAPPAAMPNRSLYPNCISKKN